ncbi:unnamed protein product [Thlaspi arvense]|uniref:Micro-fibrillar-associated protein 1 C-terminal domain-containing protein n=1 Tax=Thlaspi arvense TaxID=13288 RepID=A0AAU9RXP8_THLAR|nr:unnamed protein product [Thlaspi arvense]
MSVTAGVSDAAIATREKLRGGIGRTKVRRYWPGKAPKWAEEDHDDDVLDGAFQKHDDHDSGSSMNKDDPRLRRLAQSRGENREQARADHRRVRQPAEIISTEEELMNQEGSDDEEDALEERRSRIREKYLKRGAQEEADLLPVEEEEEEEEEESEYETDSEYEMFGITMSRPVFVPKAERDTVAERERLEAEEEALEELAKRKLEMRTAETKQIVVEEVRKDQETQKSLLLEEANNIGDVETDDEMNEAEEYEAWKTRELARIKREKDMSREKEEIDKLRNMTEQEMENPKPSSSSSSSSSAKPKKKWKFMQRYYHKGAFFQETGGSVETDCIFQRDYSAPTGEDRLEKSVLREVMQVKKFGHSGRSKWTHLVNEDTTYGDKKPKKEDGTTKWSDPWDCNGLLRQKYKRKMAVMDALPIARPKGCKKMKAW